MERGINMEQDVFVRLYAREGEEGLSFEMFRSARDPRLFYIHSRWMDEAAFQKHAELAHTLRFLGRVDALLDEPRIVSRTQRME